MVIDSLSSDLTVLKNQPKKSPGTEKVKAELAVPNGLAAGES